MAYVFTLDVPANEELYAEIRAELPATPPPGLISHVVVPGEAGLRYIDVWSTRESWEEARDAVLEPAVGRVLACHGLPPDESLTRFEEIAAVDVWLPLTDPSVA
jgi:hypothetical protein